MDYISNNESLHSSYNENNDRSDSESIQSTPEDDRIRRLFFTCDTDGDGFITYDDIRQVCAQLDMDYCVEEIMQELGTDANGRISYADFVKRRSELLEIKPSDTSEDCESTISESKEPLLEQSSQASSFEMSSMTDEQAFGSQPNSQLSRNRSQSTGIWGQREVSTIETENSGLTEDWLAFKRHDSWEFDSGAHDLEVDTISLHKQIEASGIQLPANINELLDLANRYYIESINSIKQEKIRIHSQLKTILEERQLLQKQILSLKNENISVIKDLEMKKLKEKKEYENKIFELQSIITELSQNLNYYHFLTIKEEDENYEQENEISDKSSSNLNAIKNMRDSEEYNSETNLNSNIEVISKSISKQMPNELVVSETEKVNTSGIDRKESHDNDSHANALQIDRLEQRISNLKTQIDRSDLHLNQTKGNAERLTALLSKYESNNTGLQLALNYSETALEGTQILVTLLETEIGLVLANCRAAGLGKNVDLPEEEEREEVMRIYELSTQKRKEAEESALQYLRDKCPEFEINSNTFCREHENQLRNVLMKMKEEKAIVNNSITHLEPFIDHLDKDCNSLPDSNAPDMTRNIEDIVLIQDFISIKETNAKLRSRIHSLQRENSILTQEVMKWKSNEENTIETDLKDSNERKEQNLGECEESDPIVIDLKKANDHLNQELEKIKRKYSMKVKKLEQKISSMSQRNSAQVKILQNKISLLENDGSFRKSIETTL